MDIRYNNYGFELIREEDIKEINARGVLLKHTSSGATLFKLLTEDSNNTFCITFKTLPSDDKGIPHILEHSVLNGSEKFPVKSPFTTLLQGSLNTFLNALTGKDRTMYPVASKNRKDFFNLMNVYLDAVFNPMIYKNPMIFRQEGWHTAFDSEEKPEFNGVVYSEMKGAFSSPATLHSKYVYKNLFPTTTYGTVSGGYPEAILELQEEEFLNFHRKYYHPSNSLIFLYGDGNFEEELEFLNREYLAAYKNPEEEIKIPREPAIEEPVTTKGSYPVSADESLDNKTTLSISWLCEPSALDVLGLDMVSTLLTNMPSSPLRKALMNSECGEDTYSSFSHLNQSVMNIVLKNSSEEKFDLFRKTVEDTLEDIVKNGFDPAAVEGLINRYEFDLREGEGGSFPKAIEYCYSILSSWYYFDDPFAGVEFETSISSIRDKVKNGYFEDLVKDNMLNNRHRSEVLLAPVSEKEEKTEALPDLNKEEKTTLLKEYKELTEYQNSPDSEEDLAKIPMLGLNDLPSEPDYYPPYMRDHNNLEYHCFSGGIVYPTFMFDASFLDKDLIPYLSILTSLLGELDTRRRRYEDLDSEINIHTGGISFSSKIYLRESNPDKFTPYLSVSSKIVSGKTDKLLSLIEEILFETEFKDLNRIREITGRLLSRYESLIRGQGYTVGSGIFEAELGRAFIYREMTEGVSFFRFLQKFNSEFKETPELHIEKLKEVMKQIVNKNNLLTFISGSDSDCTNCRPAIDSFRDKLPADYLELSDLLLTPLRRDIGLTAPSQVQYVFKGCDFIKLGYEYTGIVPLLSQIIGRDYMHQKIRVAGGAYGAISTLKRTGIASFSSYRDPNLKQTIEAINGIDKYIESLQLSDTALTRFKTGTIAALDKHLTPSEQGKAAIQTYFRKAGMDQLKTEREQLLTADNNILRSHSGMLSKILADSITVAYGNSAVINEAGELFDVVLPLLSTPEK